MFGTKEENNSKSGTQTSNQTNQFVEGTVIQGEVKSANDIRVDGSIIGTLQSSSKIVIGGKGKIDGDIKCQNADISGTVRGTIEVKDLLFLKNTSVIEGDIVANKLVVESGAKFNGNCSMGNHQVKNEEIPATSFKKEAI